MPQMLQKQNFQNRSFTFIEILIVMGIIGILNAVLFVFIKPQEIFKKNRDFQRTTDIQVINSAINIFQQEYPSTSIGEFGKVYISLPDSSSDCSSWTSQLPLLPSGFQYVCSSNPNSINEDGWIPINFAQTSAFNISKLPLDPQNSPPYYYSYSTDSTNGKFEVLSYLELDSNKGINSISGKDSGTSWNVYEFGSNLKLIPYSVEDGMGRDENLRSYWVFDENQGATAFDASVNKMDGIIYGGALWQNGKLRSGVRLDNRTSPNDYIQIPHNSKLNFTNKMSLSLWVYPVDRNLGNTSQTIINKEGSYEIMLSGGNPPTIWWALMGTSPNGWAVNLSTTTLARGDWHNVVFVYNGQNVKIYVNGNLRYLINESGNIIDNRQKPLRIGFRYDDPGAYFNGVVDEIRMYDKELSASEIQTLYNAVK